MADERNPRRGARLLWFIALWCAGVLTLATLAWLIRLALGL